MREMTDEELASALAAAERAALAKGDLMEACEDELTAVLKKRDRASAALLDARAKVESLKLEQRARGWAQELGVEFVDAVLRAEHEPWTLKFDGSTWVGTRYWALRLPEGQASEISEGGPRLSLPEASDAAAHATLDPGDDWIYKRLDIPYRVDPAYQALGRSLLPDRVEVVIADDVPIFRAMLGDQVVFLASPRKVSR